MLVSRRILCSYKRTFFGANLWTEEITSEIKHKIEDYWSEKLSDEKFQFKEDRDAKDNFYILSMFPYPSGNLHMGHVRVYTISDAIARFYKMKGKNVIHPIGWDAFGLPAENAAIDHEVNPKEWIKCNISQMKTQLKTLACSFDWNREITTSDPSYYKWTQELFLKLYENGLVYRKNALVNWDPVDFTVLADEQVDDNGCSWRSGAKVEKRLLKQWFIRTTKFAKALRDGLTSPILQDWRDIIKLQEHWIGECNGVLFDFKILNSEEFISLWTPYPEYIKHVKFVAIKNTHSIAKVHKINKENCTSKIDIYLENPFTLEKIPIFVTEDIEYLNFTDTFLGIPAVCEKAREFADENGIIFEEVDKLSAGTEIDEMRNSICTQAISLGIGGYWSSAKLRDWLISRQRYWGTPIPIIICDKCGPQPVPREDLPVKLPSLSTQIKRGGLHLANCEEWVNTTCPKCQSKSKRETDTMDTFVDSSWYYLRYIDPNNKEQMFNPQKAKKVSPVDIYIGGKEHAVLHLYYARFISHFLHSLGLLPEKEPFKRLLVQGMVMGRTYRIKESGKYVPPKDIKIIDSKRNKAIIEEDGTPVIMAWEKMSKSKLNGVEPTDMFKEYGVDTTRLLILADVAPTSNRHWNTNTFPGIINWQKRMWLTIQDFLKYRKCCPPPIPEDDIKKHEDFMFDSRNFYIKATTFNYYVSQQLSVAISKQQGLTNSLRKMPPYILAKSLQFERALAAQIMLLAPMAPHFASELWAGFVTSPYHLNKSDEILWGKSVLEQKWPETDSDYKLDLVFQVNGTDTCGIKLERSILDEITLDKALSLAKRENSLKEIFLSGNIQQSNIIIHKGIKGTLNIIAKKHIDPKVNKIEEKI